MDTGPGFGDVYLSLDGYTPGSEIFNKVAANNAEYARRLDAIAYMDEHPELLTDKQKLTRQLCRETYSGMSLGAFLSQFLENET